jgi:hypothetical protein
MKNGAFLKKGQKISFLERTKFCAHDILQSKQITQESIQFLQIAIDEKNP